MRGTVQLYWGAAYTITITVDGVDIIGSPHKYLNYRPGSVYASNCVVVDTLSEVTVGFGSYFRI